MNTSVTSMPEKPSRDPSSSINSKKPISAQHASELIIHSQLDGEIAQLSELKRSLLFAELSMLAYLTESEATKAVATLGFHTVRFYNRDGAQAYSFISDSDHVIACRGTEPNEWNDIRADLDASTALAETMGRVHRGFKKEVDDLWPVLEDALTTNTLSLWFTGHSLGGAMATICAGRCLLSHINSSPTQIFTYGSPRVGNKRYISHAKIDYLRWVNNNDIVTRVPPTWLGYRHSGEERYLDAHGKLRTLTSIQRGRDRWRGFIKGIKSGEIDHFSDHLIDRYVQYIYDEAVSRGELNPDESG